MEDELTELLAVGERAAFHGRPSAGVQALQKAVVTARESGREAEATAAAWLLGVTLGASGRYGSALTVLDALRSDASGVERRLFASLSASTAASLHRQLGRHEAALALDEQALELADGASEALFDAHLGLASDALGLGDPERARASAEAASALTQGRADWWRQRVRLAWVQAELALIDGRPEQAISLAASSVNLAEASGAPRHVARGLLLEGVGLVEKGDLDAAAATLRRASTLAESLGTMPLLWRARALLGALTTLSHPDESVRALSSARTCVLQVADDLPDELRSDWLARPDVVALLEG
jgi:tetratricopeptide (TPR) repeat protein